MLKVNCARWVQSKELLREEALKAEHPRTRERLMALYEISEGKNATQVAIETKRNPEVEKAVTSHPQAFKNRNAI